MRRKHSEQRRGGDDPRVRAAKVNRSSAILCAVITGVVTLAAAAFPAYQAGKRAGSSAASASTVVRTVTRSVAPPAASAEPSGAPRPPGSVSLHDVRKGQYTDGKWGHPYVDGARLESALYFRGKEAISTYRLDGDYTSFHTVLAVSDSTDASTQYALTVSLDGAVQRTPFTVQQGHKATVDLDVTDGRVLTLASERTSKYVDLDTNHMVLIDPVVRG